MISDTMTGGTEFQHFESAVELVDLLLDGDSWGHIGSPMHDWLFRGQPDSHLKLCPTAFRAECWRPFRRLAASPRIPSAVDDSNQRTSELLVARAFIDRCDREGLEVPGITEWLQLDPDEEPRRVGFFPGEGLRPGLALARHHGIPSRLLDWSESPLIAAYFAASGAIDDFESSRSRSSAGAERRIAIWALDVARATRLRGRPPRVDEHILALRLPWSPNSNLRAQKGWFTLRMVDSMNDGDRHEAFEDTVQRLSLGASSPILRALTLPVAMSPELLVLLRERGVDAATAFPGYESVVRSLAEQKYFRSLFPETAEFSSDNLEGQ